MKIFKSILLVAILSLVVGCSSKQPEKYVNPEFAGAPKWVMMPKVKGYIADIGIAKQNAGDDFSFQREEAMSDARDNLAKQISVKVKNMFKAFKSTTGSNSDKTFDNSSEKVSKQLANETLNGSRLEDTWVSQSGTLYVLMVVDSKSVKDLVGKSIKTSYGNDKAMYQKFLASQAQGELAKELEKK
jgi:hypothetical protein